MGPDTRDFYYSNLVRKVRCTGTAEIAVREGLNAVAATREHFSWVSDRAGHPGKMFPSRSDRKQTLPDCNSVVHGTLVWVTRVQQPTATGFLTTHACRSQSLN